MKTHAVFHQIGWAPPGRGGKFVQIWRKKRRECTVAMENGDLIHCIALQKFLFSVTQPLQNLSTIKSQKEETGLFCLLNPGENILKRFYHFFVEIVCNSNQPWINLLIVGKLSLNPPLIQCFNCSVNIWGEIKLELKICFQNVSSLKCV